MYEMKRTVRCSQLGQGGIVRNSSLIDYLQDTSLLHLETHPVLSPFFKEESCVMFLISRQVDIVRRPIYGETLTAKTWTYELNRMYGFRNTMLYGEDGNICVKSIAGGAFMNTLTQRPMRVPAEIIKRVPVYDKYEMEYLPRKIAVPDRVPDKVEPVSIRQSDIDMNMHVNNARYIDITDEFVKNCFDIKRLRAEYKMPLKKGSEASAAVYEDEDRTIVSLENRDGKQYCIIEYFF